MRLPVRAFVALVLAAGGVGLACSEDRTAPRTSNAPSGGKGGGGTMVCGDCIVDSGETCDDCNADNGDGCSRTCQLEGDCSDLRACCFNVICPKVGCNTNPANVCDDGTLYAITMNGDAACGWTLAKLDEPACRPMEPSPDAGAPSGTGGTAGSSAGRGGTAGANGGDGASAGAGLGGEGGESSTTPCSAGMVACGEDCVNLNRDPDHCGDCDASCGADGACLGGTCAVILARDQDGPAGIAVNAKYVYWANGGDETVQRAPVAGGAVQKIADAPGVCAVALDGSSLYWGGAEVVKVPLGGGTPVVLGETDRGTCQIAVQGDYVYWLDSGGLGRAQTDGSGQETFDAWPTGFGFALTPTYAYWANYGPAGYIYRTPLGAGVRGDVVPASNAEAFVSIGEDIYWIEFADRGSIRKRLPNGQTSLASASNATQMATDGSELYWVEDFGASIQRLALPDGAGNRQTVITLDDAAADWLAVDTTSVYWTSEATGMVMKTAK